jgi:hypothetical protein
MDVINAWHNFDGEEIQYCKDSKCPLHPMCPKFFRCNSCGICFKQEHIDGAMKLAEEKLFRTYDFYEKNVNKS